MLIVSNYSYRISRREKYKASALYLKNIVHEFCQCENNKEVRLKNMQVKYHNQKLLRVVLKVNYVDLL